MEIKRIQSPEGTNQIQAEEQIKQTGTAATGDDIAPFQPDFLQTVDATLQPAGSRSQLVNQLKSLMSEILQSTLGSNTQVKELTAGVDRNA